MKKSLSLSLASLLFALFAGVASLSAASETGELHTTVDVETEASVELVRDSVIKSLLARGWAIKSKTDDQVVSHLKLRGWDSTLTFKISQGKVEIYSDSYTLKKNGDRKKARHPEGWIANLARDIPVYVSRKLHL